jgi:phenylacetate-CoA ligase
VTGALRTSFSPIPMSLSGKLLLGTTHLLRHSRTLKILREIRPEPYKPPAEILRRQFLRLSGLLAVGEAHIPYYRELFKSLGIQARDIRSLSDFASLPILTKDIIRERRDDLVREDVPRKKLKAVYSGGSTGVPLKFYRTRFDLDAGEAGTFRGWLQSGWEPGDMVAHFWGDRELYKMSAWELEIRQRLRRMYQFDAFHSSPEQMDQWFETLQRIRPKILYGYSSLISRFAAHVEGTGRKMSPVLGVFCTAEKLYPNQQEVISRVFRCPVYDMYGSSEVNNVACTCSRGRMHINVDQVVLETDDSTTLPGQPPALIVTSLWNDVMPLIRYRIEDCGQLLDGACDCGSHFPLMELNVSRIFDHFIMPDGRFIHGMLFIRFMDVAQGIATFQFHQVAPELITLWIVPGPSENSARERSIQKVVDQVTALDPQGRIKVDVRIADSIPLSRNGKHRFIRSDVQSGKPVPQER